jgi:hypothetical protein
VNLLRKASFVVTAGMAFCCAALVPAQANRLQPHYYAYSQLQYGSGWEAYDAGCLTWDYRTQSWYSHCGLPQNAVLARRVLSVRD